MYVTHNIFFIDTKTNKIIDIFSIYEFMKNLSNINLHP